MRTNTSCRSLVVTILVLLMTASSVAIGAESRWIRQERGKTKTIVFVHGVVGDSTSTWTSPRTGAYWPSLVSGDPTFERSNVYVFQYPSPPTGRSLSVNELAEAMRRRLQSDGVLNSPELIFLSHSMGGLVTRAFLLKYREHASKVKMAFFYATPTEGSPAAKLASLASRNPQFKSMYPLQSDSYLADLQRDWLAARLGIRSFCAYEGEDTYGLRIVDQRSATNLCTEPLDPISEDHIQIVKPADGKADSYIAFKNAYEAVARDGGVIPHSDRTKIDHPLIDPAESISRQVQLYPEDKVRIYGPESLRRVWFGGEWERFNDGRTYVVIGRPGQTVSPRFEPMPTSSFKIEVEYNKYVDEPRDLRNAGLSRVDPAALKALVQFPPKSATLSDPAKSALRQVAAAVVGINLEVITIVGTADLSEGERSFAEGLARRRAQVVREFLAERGIEKNRLYTDSRVVGRNSGTDSVGSRTVDVEAVPTRFKK